MFNKFDMAKMTVTIRDVDEDTFKDLKAFAAQNDLNLAGALNMAVSSYLSSNRKIKKFTSFKPIKGGKGTEHVSEQVDEIMYGG